jgi:uncharacterized protein (DUF779 family)
MTAEPTPEEGRGDGPIASIEVTDEARAVIESIAADIGEAVVVELNDGCCDGMGPLAVRESMVGHNDVRIGVDGSVEVYTPPNRAEPRRGYEIVVDVVDAVGGEGAFSLEVPRGVRLVAEERRTDAAEG